MQWKSRPRTELSDLLGLCIQMVHLEACTLLGRGASYSLGSYSYGCPRPRVGNQNSSLVPFKFVRFHYNNPKVYRFKAPENMELSSSINVSLCQILGPHIPQFYDPHPSLPQLTNNTFSQQPSAFLFHCPFFRPKQCPEPQALLSTILSPSRMTLRLRKSMCCL